MNIKKLFSYFNHPNTLLVISSYPDPKTGIEGLDAVAWHSQKTLHSLAAKNKRIVVFSEISSQKKPYLDSKNILVCPLWQKGKPLSFFKALLQVFKFPQAKTILFQFEFNIFGGILPVLIIPLFLLLFRLSGKKIIFEIHQVIINISTLSTHLHLKNRLIEKILNLGLLSFYQAVGFLSQHIVTLEQELKTRLSTLVSADKISFIPISTQIKNKLPQNQAKQKLGFKSDDFVVISFGFINWYKGSDWLVKAFSQIKDKNIKLIMAGGPSPTLKDKTYYQKYFSQFKKTVNSNKNISLTGFIHDDQVKLYFSAADLVVLPYRIFMSSSGPLSLAFSYSLPFLLSTPLAKNYINSPDFYLSLKKAGLNLSDISFPLNSSAFNSKIKVAKKNLKVLAFLSKLIKKQRSQANTSQKYLNLINSSKINHAYFAAPNYQAS